MRKYYYSETFFSFQGEGKYVGVPSVWLRLFSCNLQCDGFGQVDPTDPSTYELPYKHLDLIDIKTVEELPVFDKGCDSSYTWSKKYRHLMKHKTASEITDELLELLPHKHFIHPVSGLINDFVITGGEPMLQQQAIIDILEEMIARNETPNRVTIETNGTVKLTEKFKEFSNVLSNLGIKLFFSISPKLFSVSGEQPKKAIKTDVMSSYINLAKTQLKFVVNGGEAAWLQIEGILKELPPVEVFTMGVGGTLEGLTVTESMIAEQSINRGYNYTSRVHVHVFGNEIGK